MTRYRVDYMHRTAEGPEFGEATVEADSAQQAEDRFLDLQPYPIDYDINGVKGA